MHGKEIQRKKPSRAGSSVVERRLYTANSRQKAKPVRKGRALKATGYTGGTKTSSKKRLFRFHIVEHEAGTAEVRAKTAKEARMLIAKGRYDSFEPDGQPDVDITSDEVA